ncbi:MAG: glycine betaine ABC transporter substrate-binding protein [Planctomycetota bacterium]
MTMQSKILIMALCVAALVVVLFVGSGSKTQVTGGRETIEAAFNAEFTERADGYRGLIETYGFEFTNKPGQMETGMMYKACDNESVDVICGFATDGRIAAYDLTTLEDDKYFFPPYFAAPLVRQQTLDEHPRLKDALNKLAGRIDDSTMQELNYEVDREDKTRRPADVAREFLLKEGLIDEGGKGSGNAGSVSVGSKDFTEQLILGEMMALLIEHHTDLSVNRRMNLGGTMVCFNALRNGDLDLYAEYTGTGLVTILDREAMTDPEQTYDTVSEQFKQEWNLTWLEPFGFNNTYTLTMRSEQAERLGIRSISDLAEYINDSEVE